MPDSYPIDKNQAGIEQETRKSWEDNWSRVSQQQIDEIFGYPRVQKLSNFWLAYLPKEGFILEAGCGLAPWVKFLKKRGYRAIGIDYNETTISQAKNYESGLNLAVADVRRLPFLDNSIAAYISYGVIEHFIEGPDEAIRETLRVLKKGGRAVILVPHRNIFKIIKAPIVCLKRNRFLRRIFHRQEKAYYFERFFDPKGLENKFLDSGFKVILTKPVDHIFSLIELSGIFRDKNTYDGENKLAVSLGSLLERYLPSSTAASNLYVLEKQ